MADQSGGGSTVWIGVALVFIGMMGRDMMTSPETVDTASDVGDKVSEESMAGNIVHFQYCYSWGYEKVYRQLAGVLQQELGLQYPDLVIQGDNYNPGGGRVQLSQLIGLLKFIVIGMVAASFNPWTKFGSDVMGPTPGIVTWAMENKIYACLMTFFLCNMVETQLISSGAFEVTVNGENGKILK